MYIPISICGVTYGIYYFCIYCTNQKLTNKIVLITGCGKGFGYELVKRLHKLNVIVIATCRRQESVDQLC